MKINMNLAKIVMVVSIVFLVVGFGVVVRAQTVMGPPTVPGNLSATVTPPSQVSISWSGSTGGSGNISYYVYQNGQAINSTSSTSFTETSLPPGVYSYAVAAYDSTGSVSARSTPVSVTIVLDTTPPSAPTGLTATPTTTYVSYASTTIALSWNASTDNVGVVGYYVYRDGVKITTSTTSPVTATSYTDTVPPAQSWTYTYTVAAYDAAGNISAYSSPVQVLVLNDILPPSAPTQLTATQNGLTQISLSWASSTDSIPIAGYYIYKNGAEIATVSSSPYSDTGISAGSSYSYVVDAYDAAGNVSASSTQVNVTVMGDNAQPSVPFGIVAKASSSSIAVSWEPSTDAIAVAGYVLYRNGTQLATVTTTSYVDDAPMVGSNLYSVYAYNLGGVSSSLSNTVNAAWYPGMITAAPPVPAVAPVAVTTAPASAPVAVTPTAPPASATPVINQPFTTTLYYGLRSADVTALQSLLTLRGYLSSPATGFFGNLTLQALEKFQCDNNIVCTGGAGWGIVGPKTRAVLNGLAPASNPAASSTSLQVELQTLEAELKALEAQTQ